MKITGLPFPSIASVDVEGEQAPEQSGMQSPKRTREECRMQAQLYLGGALFL